MLILKCAKTSSEFWRALWDMSEAHCDFLDLDDLYTTRWQLKYTEELRHVLWIAYYLIADFEDSLVEDPQIESLAIRAAELSLLWKCGFSDVSDCYGRRLGLHYSRRESCIRSSPFSWTGVPRNKQHTLHCCHTGFWAKSGVQSADLRPSPPSLSWAISCRLQRSLHKLLGCSCMQRNCIFWAGQVHSGTCSTVYIAAILICVDKSCYT